MRRFQVVIIGQYDANRDECTVAYETSKYIASIGGVVITGGRGGIMEAANKGAKDNSGLSICITPYDCLDKSNCYCDIEIATGIGWARNMINVLSGDLVIAIGGGSGTLSELAYAWMANKPIIAYSNTSGWSGKLAGDKIDNRRKDRIIKAHSIDHICDLIYNQYLLFLDKQ